MDEKRKVIPIKKAKPKDEQKVVLGVYNHDIMDDDLGSCGISVEAFMAKNGKMNEIVSGLDESKNFLSQLAEKLEEEFTAREIAFMCAKQAYHTMSQAYFAQQQEEVRQQQLANARSAGSPIIKG